MARRDEEATAARDFTMARILAARVAALGAIAALDEFAAAMVTPSADKAGKRRSKLLEDANAYAGDVASSVQLAMTSFDDVDPTEEEPEPDDEEEDEEEDDEDDEDEDEDDEDD